MVDNDNVVKMFNDMNDNIIAFFNLNVEELDLIDRLEYMKIIAQFSENCKPLVDKYVGENEELQKRIKQRMAVQRTKDIMFKMAVNKLRNEQNNDKEDSEE